MVGLIPLYIVTPASHDSASSDSHSPSSPPPHQHVSKQPQTAQTAQTAFTNFYQTSLNHLLVVFKYQLDKILYKLVVN